VEESELENLLRQNPNLKVRESGKLKEIKLPEKIVIAHGTMPLPKMNKLEASYAQFLDLQKYRKEILDWKYEPMNLKLSGMKCFYRIDFLVIGKNLEIEMHETKGDYVQDDSLVKFKVASEQFPYFIFKWVTKELVRFALEAKNGGFGKYGIRPIIERARWHSRIETKGDDFKINNDYCSRYARLMMENEQHLRGFFETRRFAAEREDTMAEEDNYFWQKDGF
jgi:hypothetical protein